MLLISRAVGLANPLPAYLARSRARPRTWRIRPRCWRWAPRQAAHKPRCQIAHDVTIKIRQQEHVKLQGIHHDLHAGVINDEFFVLDKGMRRDKRGPISETSRPKAS